MTFPYLTNMRLDIEDPSLIPAGSVLNRAANPDGVSNGPGAWGWVPGLVIMPDGYPYDATPGRNTGTTPALTGLSIRYRPGVPEGGRSVSIPCGALAGGETVIAGWDASPGPDEPSIETQAHHGVLEGLDINGAVVSTSSSASNVTPGARTIGPVTMPATARSLRFRIVGDAATDAFGRTGADARSVYGFFTNVRIGVGVSSVANVVERRYTDVLPLTNEVKVTRQALNLGELVATMRNDSLDPATNPLLRPNRQVRLYTTDGLVRQHLFVGSLTDAPVKYLPRTDGRRASITMTAVDRTALLAQVKRPEGYTDYAKAALIVQDVMPFLIGQLNIQQTKGLATVNSINANATALDQLALARDSRNGFAWVSRDGRARLELPSALAGVKRIVNSTEYDQDLDVGFDLDQVINTTSITVLRTNLATGETVEVVHGPYVRQSSVDEWGPRSADFTVSIADTDAAARAYAEKVFDAQATPLRRVNRATVQVDALVDGFTASTASTQKGLLDLYDLVRVQAPQGDQTSRIAGMTHTITPKSWIVDLDFTRDGGVAPPQESPPIGTPAPIYPGTPWLLASNRTATNYGASTDIDFSTIVADPTGGWERTADNRWSVPQSGLYRVTFTWKWNSNATAKPGRVLVNGLNRIYGPAIPAVAFGGYSISGVLSLDVDDTVSAQVDIAMTTQSDGAEVDNNFLLIEPLNY